ncbi:transposase (resolvase, DNA invertase) [Legionella steelei]|uniref:Transposase (Resolvase, DNA invertase) n=1 Tax=Legionella steelei TaxID=947033 RepID=A0A0W0ZFQ7_9GAMM|nr:recombinase family protein [Legionella steelei]KTD68220.1 transposase (resolvase, DNA invertase) [Legionella steelei]
MKIGYARVSTLEQNLDLQIDALEKAGCKKIITDEISGSVAERPGLTRLKEDLREGDTVVVWRLDRLGRSLKHLIALVNDFELLKVGFESLQESINTTTSTGQLIFHMFGALAEFERNLIRERTKAGLASARSRGRLGGRPKQLDSNKRQLVGKLYKDREHTVQEICQMMGISKPTLYQYLREMDGKTNEGKVTPFIQKPPIEP